MNAIVLPDRLEATPIDQSKPILSIDDLNVRFGSVVAIESLSLTVRRGEFVSLLGPSGCGKSTLLKAIARLVRPTCGRIARSYDDLRTGFMFQKPLLLPWRTTLDNVLLPVEIQRGGNTVDSAGRRNALRMLDLVRLLRPSGKHELCEKRRYIQPKPLITVQPGLELRRRPEAQHPSQVQRIVK